MLQPTSLNSSPRRPIRTFTGHADPVNACAISPDGSFVVSGAGNTMKIYGRQNDFTLKVWDFETGTQLFTLAGHEEAIKGCAISRDNAFILSVAEDCLAVWDAQTGTKLNRFNPPGLACSSCTEDSAIAIVSFFIVLLDFQTGEEQVSILTEDMLHDCAINSDGSLILTAGTDQHLVVWNAKNGEQVKALKAKADLDSSGDVTACEISPDGTFMVSGGSDGDLRIWSADSLQEWSVLSGHKEDITACAVNHDDSMVVSSSMDGTLKIWEAGNGKLLDTLMGHKGSVNGCAFSPCCGYVISAGDDTTVNVWDITDLR